MPKSLVNRLEQTSGTAVALSGPARYRIVNAMSAISSRFVQGASKTPAVPRDSDRATAAELLVLISRQLKRFWVHAASPPTPQDRLQRHNPPGSFREQSIRKTNRLFA